jgi:hypothetical protein
MLPTTLTDRNPANHFEKDLIVNLLKVRRPFYGRRRVLGPSAKLPARWEGKMRSIFILSALLCATNAFAADQYQITPLYSLAIPGRPQVHTALIINETNGDNYTCSAFVHQEMPIGFDSIECSKAVNKVGSMPPGPAALSPFAHQSAAPYPAIWKIDQTNGMLTFCAATEVPAGGWLCGSSKLQ